MKKFMWIMFVMVALCLSGFASGTSFAAGDLNYGFVDVAKVFDEYQKTKDNDKQLQEEGAQKEKEREVLVKEVRALKDELVLLQDDAKAKKQEMLDEKVRKLQDFDAEAKKILGEKRNRLVREIFQDIENVIQQYGQRKGYDFVFNDRALLYQNPKYDVTQDVLQELNKTYKK